MKRTESPNKSRRKIFEDNPSISRNSIKNEERQKVTSFFVLDANKLNNQTPQKSKENIISKPQKNEIVANENLNRGESREDSKRIIKVEKPYQKPQEEQSKERKRSIPKTEKRANYTSYGGFDISHHIRSKEFEYGGKTLSHLRSAKKKAHGLNSSDYDTSRI